MNQPKMPRELKLTIFAWWLILEVPAVYAVAHPLGDRAAHASDWFMGAMLGTMIASMFCAASTAFIGWVFFDWDPL